MQNMPYEVAVSLVSWFYKLEEEGCRSMNYSVSFIMWPNSQNS